MPSLATTNNLHFLPAAYSPRRFLPAAVLFGDIVLLSAAGNFLIEQSEMSGEAGTEHSKVDLDVEVHG